MFYILFTYFILLFSVIYIGLSIRYTKQCKQRQQIGDTSHDCKFRFMSVRSKYRTGPTHQLYDFWIDSSYNCTWASVRNSPPREVLGLDLAEFGEAGFWLSRWVVARRSSWSWASYGPAVGRLMTLLHVRSLEEPQRKRLGAAMLRLLYPLKVAGNPALPWIRTKTLPPTGQSRRP